jgi:hypothetical protein
MSHPGAAPGAEYGSPYASAPASSASWGAPAGRTRLNSLFEEAALHASPAGRASIPPWRAPSLPPGYGGPEPPQYASPPRRRDGLAPGWPRVSAQATPARKLSTREKRAARQALESGRDVWRSRAALLRRLALREWLARWCAREPQSLRRVWK